MPALTLPVASYLSANHGVPFCGACIAVDVHRSPDDVGAAILTLAATGVVRTLRFSCAVCRETAQVAVAVRSA